MNTALTQTHWDEPTSKLRTCGQHACREKKLSQDLLEENGEEANIKSTQPKIAEYTQYKHVCCFVHILMSCAHAPCSRYMHASATMRMLPVATIRIPLAQCACPSPAMCMPQLPCTCSLQLQCACPYLPMRAYFLSDLLYTLK